MATEPVTFVSEDFIIKKTQDLRDDHLLSELKRRARARRKLELERRLKVAELASKHYDILYELGCTGDVHTLVIDPDGYRLDIRVVYDRLPDEEA